MNASAIQIVSMFEDAHLSPEQISEDLGYDVVSIKATLLQYSRVYRASDGNDVKDEELVEMLDLLKDMARMSENEGVKLKAICRVIDEKKGRLDALREVRHANAGVIQFNQFLIDNRRAKEKVIELDKIACA